MPDALIDGTGSGYVAKVDNQNRLHTDSLISNPVGSPIPVNIYNSYTNGSQVGPMALDDATFASTTISYEHHEIHSGDHFNIRNFGTLASGESLVFGFSTPNTTKWAHLVFEITGTNQTEVRGWEGATLSGGTTVPLFNNNRNSPNTCDCVIVIDPVVSGASPTSGLLIESHSKGLTGTPPSKALQNGTADREDEWVLKSGTTYMWEIKSAGTGNIIDYSAVWYEQTDKIQKF